MCLVEVVCDVLWCGVLRCVEVVWVMCVCVSVSEVVCVSVGEVVLV